MNSMLAQLDEGLINSFSLEQSEQEEESEGTQSARGKSAGLTANLKVGTGLLPGGNLGISGSLGNTGDESESYSRTFLEGQKDILNKAFHDYALDLLIEKLHEKSMIVETGDFKEGNLYIGESTYRFYDFNLLKKSMDYSAMKEIMLADAHRLGLTIEHAKTIVNKQKLSAKERELIDKARQVTTAYESIMPIIDIIKNLNTLSSFASNLLEDLTVIKTNNQIGLLKKEYLRESVESLTFRTDKSRKVRYLVRIIGKKDVVYDGSNLPLINGDDLDFIPNMMLDIILGSFDIIKKGDLLVTPIAIYYE